MSATILSFPTLRRAQADATDRMIDAGNRFLARGLRLVPVPVMCASVPVVGRLNDETKMQLEDGE